MRKILFIITIGLIFLTNCTGVRTSSIGLENEALLEFIGNTSNYKDGIEINIDDNNSFKAEVNKNYADRPKGNVYAISPGKHIITVTYHNEVIFKKQIFVSAQETKKIILP